LISLVIVKRDITIKVSQETVRNVFKNVRVVLTFKYALNVKELTEINQQFLYVNVRKGIMMKRVLVYHVCSVNHFVKVVVIQVNV
jgi:hypothetical protein